MRKALELCWIGILGLLALHLLPDKLWAASSESGPGAEVFWQFVSLVLIGVLLVYALRKPTRAFLQKRRDEIKYSLDQAARTEDESEKNLAEWQQKINLLSAEIKALHDSICQEGEKERKRIAERTQEAAQKIREEAQALIEREMKKARTALKKEMIDLSVKLAEDLLREKTQPQDQERLVSEFVGRMREMR
jgi:F-type H+-transporting ATPase subunit b